MSSFPCTKCGACCRLIGNLPEMKDFNRGDGVCKNLTKDNLCKIYDSRPDICRMDKMQPPVMTNQEWHRRNAIACNKLHLRVYGHPIAR